MALRLTYVKNVNLLANKSDTGTEKLELVSSMSSLSIMLRQSFEIVYYAATPQQKHDNVNCVNEMKYQRKT